MSKIRINNIHPAFRIIQSLDRALILSNSEQGIEVGYLYPYKTNLDILSQTENEDVVDNDLFPSDQHALIKKLYQKSLEFEKSRSDKCIVISNLYLAQEVYQIDTQIRKYLSLSQTDIKYNLRIKIDLMPEKIEEIVEGLANFSIQFSQTKEIFDNNLLIQLNISPIYNWKKDIIVFLDKVFDYNFLRIAVYFPKELALENKINLQWLKELQEAGYSLPFIFEEANPIKRKDVLEIIEWSLGNGLAKSIEIDKMGLFLDEDEQQKKTEAYHNFLQWWFAESSAPVLSLIDIIKMIDALTYPVGKRFNYFLGSNLSFNMLPSPATLSQLWEKLCSYSSFLGPIFPTLLPIHYFRDNDVFNSIIGNRSLKHYCHIVEDCIAWIIKAMIDECEKAVQENRPLTLDLSNSRPIYRTADWRDARSIAYPPKEE